MKLIDAEQCPCYKCGATCPYNHPLDDCKKFSYWILGTAYDVDKVVNDLEYASYCKSTPTFDHPYTDSIIDLDEAINIVKRGGIDEVG